jgi:hypothetical protein
MPLDETQKQKLRGWIRSRGIRLVCASCRAEEWGAGEIVSAPVLDREGTLIEEMHVPMVQLVCINCSYVMMYAAAPIGLP